MLFSSSILRKAMNDYNKKKEMYGKSKDIPMSYIIVAVIFVLIELVILFYAVNIALTCGTTTGEKFIHVVLAVLFTLPYLLFMVISRQKCFERAVNLKHSFNFGSCGMPNRFRFSL